MTRKEQINLYLKERNVPLDSLEANSIIEGIEWSDSHPMFYKGQTRKMMDSEVEFTDEWFKNHKEQPTYADAIEWAINNSPKGTSLIKWQTGEPKESGSYLVTIDGSMVTCGHYSCLRGWSHWKEDEITAWCKLSDVEPYKE